MMTKFYFITILALTSLPFALQARENVTGKWHIDNPDSSKFPGNGISASFDTAYCYIAYDQPNNRSGPAKFALADPGNIILLADQSGLNYVAGGTWGFDKKWFGIVSTDFTLISIDPLTGERVLIGATGILLSGITFDYTSNTMFGVGWDGLSSSLFSINTTNGTATLVGQCGTDLLINLACDATGNLYSVGIINDYFYTINKSTGVFTPVGSIGFEANYEQDMEFDLTTGILYMAAYNGSTSSGEFRTVDPGTGASTLVGKFQGGAEITGLCIPNSAINVDIAELPKTESSIKIYPNPGPGIFTVESNLKSALFEVTNVLGKIIYSEEISSYKAEIDMRKNQKGAYFYQVKKGSKILGTGKIIIE